MKKCLILSLIVGLALISMVAFTGCSKDDDDPDPLDVTGTWVITQVGDSVVVTASLSHSGTTVTGTVSDSTNYSDSITGSTTIVAGLTSPRNITLIITYSDARVSTLTGTVSDNNKSMNGTYTDTNGNSDSWTATKQ